MEYRYGCPHYEMLNSLKREHAAFAVEQQCSDCGEWIRVQVSGPDLELTVAIGAAPAVTP